MKSRSAAKEIAVDAAIAVLVVLGVANVLVVVSGGHPLDIAWRILAGTWGTPYGIAQVLFKATPLLLSVRWPTSSPWSRPRDHMAI